ncbi:hypothetical protein B0H17DRAFT_1115912 [Mycena rosella]|uniref:Uncharacterized protein n=1 Tax=Mycena rosella TaxID=1033263 RepID=A0AAD7FC83_MYCRO|nr:hypothetical protein B0H17DRAFT_1115912 [Mycena rosella]
MTGSSSRLSSQPLRRRTHALERASTRSESSAATRIADDGSEYIQPLPSPPSSHEFLYEGDESGEEQHPREEEKEEHPDSAESPHGNPWYKPSLPVLLALTPPVANWLTGGDHLKDLLLLLLLVFYLHQLVEVPWRLYHAARPRVPPTSPSPALPATQARAAAAASLRNLELFLFLVCLLAPPAGALFLRFLASTSSDGTNTPISWFSTTLFALLTALRPLRELVSRLTARTSTLHALVHTHPAPPAPHAAEIRELRDKLERLEQRLAAREDALYGFVEDAVGPIERDVRRVERRVGKLRAKELSAKELSAPAQDKGSTTAKTIFVPAPPKPTPPSLLAWLAPLSLSSPSAPAQAVLSPPARRRSLEPIPEEGDEYGAPAASTSSARKHTHAAPVAVAPQREPPAPALGHALLALALWPLHVLLAPVRGAVRALGGGG